MRWNGRASVEDQPLLSSVCRRRADVAFFIKAFFGVNQSVAVECALLVRTLEAERLDLVEAHAHVRDTIRAGRITDV